MSVVRQAHDKRLVHDRWLGHYKPLVFGFRLLRELAMGFGAAHGSENRGTPSPLRQAQGRPNPLPEGEGTVSPWAILMAITGDV